MSQDHPTQDRRPSQEAPGRSAGDEAGRGAEEMVEAALAAAQEHLAVAGTLAELEDAAGAALGRGGELASLQRGIAGRPVEERPRLGRLIQQARARLESLVAERRESLSAAERAARLAAEAMDLSEIVGEVLPGRMHVVTQTWEELEDIFVGMGFVVAEGPEVEDEWHNFDALNTPADHPARAEQDSFYLRPTAARGTGGAALLRTQTSPVQIRLMETQAPPIWAVSPGRVYRRDTADATHLPYFHQIEALVVDEGISFADLAGTIDSFTRAFFGAGVRSRLRPAYFPFTEPSAEFDITCTVCSGAGCRTCGGVGWLELGGSGMVDPAVFEAVGLDPERWSGFAFGFGIDRLALMRWGIPDLRLLVENDVRFLSQF